VRESVRIIDCLPPHHPIPKDRSKIPTWVFVGVCVGILAYVLLAVFMR